MQQLEDRRRDQAHTVEGRTQMRFANLQIRDEPDAVADALRAVLERLAQQRQERLFVDDLCA
jgi:very-short-patch-repair endonuclease